MTLVDRHTFGSGEHRLDKDVVALTALMRGRLSRFTTLIDFPQHLTIREVGDFGLYRAPEPACHRENR